MKRLLLISACFIFLCWPGHEAAAQRRSSPTARPAAVSSRVPRPVSTLRSPSFPQYYIKDQAGFPIPVVPIFIVPVAPPVPPASVAKPACYRFFCD
jgi:hypothetical protein